jgi:ADP-dependent NAD(P)H-hydrate dehydratase / NAD(P)H-hydrate epimerase
MPTQCILSANLAGSGALALRPGHNWPLHDVGATRRIEQRHAAALPPHTLMQRAGLSVARLGRAIAPHAQRVWVLCGPGHNGGDGLRAASHWVSWGVPTSVTWLGAASHASEDIRASHQALLSAAAQDGAGTLQWTDEPPALCSDDLIIEALLGIGARPLDAGTPARWLSLLDAVRHAPCHVLSVDVPSGLDANTGVDSVGALVQHHATKNIAAFADIQAAEGPKHSHKASARHTLSLLTLKPGLFTAGGRDACGSIWWDDLGCDANAAPQPVAWLWQPTATAQPPQRSHANHKGSHGDVWVLGGVGPMRGAAVLAARAAMHAGAGRIWLADWTGTDTLTAAMADPAQPELMQLRAHALPWTTQPPHAVVLGCGGGTAVRSVLGQALVHAPALVLDADALNALADVADPHHAHWQSACRARTAHAATVLTPHPLEAARLLGTSTAQVQADRLAAARQLADQGQAIVVLKGSGSVVAAPGHAPHIMATGNPALAAGGTGDVLAGWLGATLAAHVAMPTPARSTLQAVSATVYAHGAAAERWPSAQTLTASALAAQAHPA